MTEIDIIRNARALQAALRAFPRRGEETRLLYEVSTYLFDLERKQEQDAPRRRRSA